MKDRPEVNQARKRKAYTRPEVRKVTLTPEEAVLGNCKVSSSTSGPTLTCNYQTLNCNAQGS